MRIAVTTIWVNSLVFIPVTYIRYKHRSILARVPVSKHQRVNGDESPLLPPRLKTSKANAEASLVRVPVTNIEERTLTNHPAHPNTNTDILCVHPDTIVGIQSGIPCADSHLIYKRLQT